MCVAKLKAPNQQAAWWGCPDPACKSTVQGTPSAILWHLSQENHCSVKRLTQVMFAVCQIHTATSERFIYVCERFGIVGIHVMQFVGVAWCERNHAIGEETLDLPQQQPSKRKIVVPDLQQPILAETGQQQQPPPNKRRKSQCGLQQVNLAVLDVQQVQSQGNCFPFSSPASIFACTTPMTHFICL